MLDYNDMAVYAEVVKEGSFTAAAKKLGIPKSNVSRRISRLEKNLGTRLLVRTTRKIHTTEIGKTYFQYCERMLEEAQNANLAASRLQEIPRGKLRISVSVTVGQALLSNIIAEYMEEFPEVNVELILTNRRVDIIEEGFDLLIRVGQLEDSTLIVKRVGTAKLFAYASPKYIKKKGITSDVENLLEYDLLIMSDSDLSKILNTKKYSSRMVVNDFYTLRRVTLDGIGISILPSYMCAEDVKQGNLVRIRTESTPLNINFYALYPSYRGITPKLSSFLDFLVKRFSPLLEK